MANPQIQTVKPNVQPSTFKRFVTTFSPLTAFVYSIGEDLTNGKTLKEALKETKTDFKNVHEANMAQIKDGIHNVAEQSREMKGWKYLFGLAPTTIEALDKTLNE